MLVLVSRTQCEITQHHPGSLSHLLALLSVNQVPNPGLLPSSKIKKTYGLCTLFLIFSMCIKCFESMDYLLVTYFTPKSRVNPHTVLETDFLYESDSRHLVQWTNKILVQLPLTPRLISNFLVSHYLYNYI